mgnify:FL=1
MTALSVRRVRSIIRAARRSIAYARLTNMNRVGRKPGVAAGGRPRKGTGRPTDPTTTVCGSPFYGGGLNACPSERGITLGWGETPAGRARRHMHERHHPPLSQESVTQPSEQWGRIHRTSDSRSRRSRSTRPPSSRPPLSQKFIFLRATPSVCMGVPAGTPNGGLTAVRRRMSRGTAERSSGGGRLTPSPASHQSGVSGGVENPPLTAGCCEAGGVGGESDA